MADRFGRVAQVVVYGDPEGSDMEPEEMEGGVLRFSVQAAPPPLRISDLRIRFQIRHEATPTPATGEISIYNMSPDNERRVRARGVRVQLLAGYDDLQGIIADGDIRHINREREGLDRITKIAFGGQVMKRAEAVFDKTYEGAVAVRDIVAEAVTAWNLDTGPLDAIPDVTVTDYTSGIVKVSTALTRLLDPLGVDWFINGRTIQFRLRGASGDDRPDPIRISTDTGMIGTPTTLDVSDIEQSAEARQARLQRLRLPDGTPLVTEPDMREFGGVRVRTLLDPRLGLDDEITVESEVLESDGPYIVVAADHSGDTRGTEWYSELEGYTPATFEEARLSDT